MEVIKNTNKPYIREYIKTFRTYFHPDTYPVIEKNMYLVRFDKGEYVYRQKDRITHLYFCVKGTVKIFVLLSNGKEQILNFCNKNDMLGDLEFLKHPNPYTNIQVTDTAEFIAVPLSQTSEILNNDPVFLRHMAVELAVKLQKKSSNPALNMYYPLESRLCSYIVHTASKKHSGDTEYYVFREKLTEVAELLGASYRHLLRTVRDLTDREILEKDKKGYVILDMEKLKILSCDPFV